MSDSNFYDEAMRILRVNFGICTNLMESKAQSISALSKLLKDNPHNENEIRLAIIHFYRQNGLNCFIHYDKKTLHIVGHLRDKVHNIYTQRICQFLSKRRITPHFELEKTKGNVVLNEKDLKKIVRFCESELNITDENLKKEVIKNAIRVMFKFSLRDGLFLKDNNMLHTKFDKEFARLNNEIRKVSQNFHPDALSEVDEQKLNFALVSVDIQDVILHNTLDILQDDLNLRHTDNLVFNHSFMFYEIQRLRLFIENLSQTHPNIKHIDSMVKSIFCVSLIARHSWVAYEATARELLKLCAENDKNALDFVGFYNGTPTNIGKKTFTKPIIIDRDGNPWVLPQIIKCLQRKVSLEFDIKQMQENLQKAESALQEISTKIKDETSKQKAYKIKEISYQELIDKHKQTLHHIANDDVPNEQAKKLSKEVGALINEKTNIINAIRNGQTAIKNLRDDESHTKTQVTQLKEQIAYTFKSNKFCFLQYDLLLQGLAEAIASGKDIKKR